MEGSLIFSLCLLLSLSVSSVEGIVGKVSMQTILTMTVTADTRSDACEIDPSTGQVYFPQVAN